MTGAPDWCVGEMPPGYQTRFEEIQRLSADLHDMDRVARLLWATGDGLYEAVRDMFGSLGYDVSSPSGDPADIDVRIDAQRRLLLHISSQEGIVERKSDELARVFDLLHRQAGERDRVVLVADCDRGSRPADRPDPVSPDALAFAQRMGVNVVKTHALFNLWRVSLEDRDRARTLVERLHAQDGGAFELPRM
jgi:hypothetical protein